jgi:TPR repeat protein
LLDDNIYIDKDVVEQAKNNNAGAVYAIACEYIHIGEREKALCWLSFTGSMLYPHSIPQQLNLLSKSGFIRRFRSGYLRLKNKFGVTPEPYYEVAHKEFDRQKYSEAKEFFQFAAKLDHSLSQFHIGLCYYNRWGLDSSEIDKSGNDDCIGNTLPLDKKLALEWFVDSAEQGHAEAAYYVGQIYENGEETPIDKYCALGWYHKSKSKGYDPADECIDRLLKQGYVYVPKG